MKISKIVPLGVFAAMLALAGCENEGKPTPTTEPEPAPNQYELPQGNHPYDTEIVEFYDENGTVVLYDFSEKDFAWNVTSDLTWTTPPAGQNVNMTLDRLRYDIADQNYVGKQFDLFKSRFADYYTTEVIELYFPRIVMLVSNLYQIPRNFEGVPAETDKTYLISFFSNYNLVVGCGNAKLDKWTAADRNKFSADINYAYLMWIMGKSVVTSLFKKAGAYSADYSSNPGAYGFVDATVTNDENGDLASYIREIVSMTEAEFAAKYLARSYDRLGRVKQKYDILVDAFNAKGIDIKKIGNGREAE